MMIMSSSESSDVRVSERHNGPTQMDSRFQDHNRSGLIINIQLSHFPSPDVNKPLARLGDVIGDINQSELSISMSENTKYIIISAQATGRDSEVLYYLYVKKARAN